MPSDKKWIVSLCSYQSALAYDIFDVDCKTQGIADFHILTPLITLKNQISSLRSFFGMLSGNSLRQKFLIGTLTITLSIIIVGIGTLALYQRIYFVGEMRNRVNQAEINVLSLIKTDNDFFDYESTNEEYFASHNSKFLITRDNFLRLIYNDFVQLEKQSEDNKQWLEKTRLVRIYFERYNGLFAKLKTLVLERGYKDFGMEGEMRNHAHALELEDMKLKLVDILSLRRHEKDFLLRHDVHYAQVFNQQMDKIISLLSVDSLRNKKAIYHCVNYRKLFNKRVEIETLIGLDSHSGIRNELNRLAVILSDEFHDFNMRVGESYTKISRSIVIIFGATLAGALILSVLSALWISTKLTKPIIHLANWVNGDTEKSQINQRDRSFTREAWEIRLLYDSYHNLILRTRHQMDEIQKQADLLDHKNQQLVKLNAELDGFLYSTAHDLRSPLSSLSGLIRLMKIENRQESLLIYMNMMEQNIGRQEDFIAQIVSYAKNNKLDINPEYINLKTLISDIFKNHEFIDGASGIQKNIFIEDEYPFASDKGRISIIFNNLISNAIRYSDVKKGESRFIRIKIAVTRECATILFSDNGIGIEEEHLDKIFNMFYRANINSKGSGLGLFILKEAIQKLDGIVLVQSLVGEGTSFSLCLPNLYHLAHTKSVIASERNVMAVSDVL